MRHEPRRARPLFSYHMSIYATPLTFQLSHETNSLLAPLHAAEAPSTRHPGSGCIVETRVTHSFTTFSEKLTPSQAIEGCSPQVKYQCLLPKVVVTVSFLYMSLALSQIMPYDKHVLLLSPYFIINVKMTHICTLKFSRSHIKKKKSFFT